MSAWDERERNEVTYGVLRTAIETPYLLRIISISSSLGFGKSFEEGGKQLSTSDLYTTVEIDGEVVSLVVIAHMKLRWNSKLIVSQARSL